MFFSNGEIDFSRVSSPQYTERRLVNGNNLRLTLPLGYVGNLDGEVRPSPMDYFHVALENENPDIQNGPNKSTINEETSRLKLISMEQVSWHDRQEDCWIIICDYVYDCTEFIKKHPGGADVLLEYAGRDATLAFVGTGHSETAKQMLSRYIIGELPVEEKIFQRVGGIRIIQNSFY